MIARETSTTARSTEPGAGGHRAPEIHSFFIYRVSLVAAVGGLLFGFDLAVIAGAIPFLIRKFSLTPGALGMAVSAVSLGCMAGTVFSGFLSDWLGRKKVLMLAALVFLFSSILAGLPDSVLMLMVARAFSGVAIGMSSPISPVYISELAPPDIRGKLVTLNQLAITLGFLAAYILDWVLASIGTAPWRDEHAWRWMFAAGAVPSAVFLFLLITVPESPRYLLKTGQQELAHGILSRVAGPAYATREVEQITRTLNVENTSIGQLFKEPFARPMIIGILLMLFSQFCGMKAVTNYSPKLLLELGFQSEAGAMQGMVGVGLVLAIATILAMLCLDKLGRRVMLGLSSGGVLISLLLLAVQFRFGVFPSWLSLLVVLFATVSYALGIGPCAWLIIAEVFPTRVRGAASSIATFTLWIADFIVLLIFPVLQNWSPTGTFLIFGGALMVIGAVLFAIVPETKGRSLEEIEDFWRIRSSFAANNGAKP